jgi:hypothetical protein
MILSTRAQWCFGGSSSTVSQLIYGCNKFGAPVQDRSGSRHNANNWRWLEIPSRA